MRNITMAKIIRVEVTLRDKLQLPIYLYVGRWEDGIEEAIQSDVVKGKLAHLLDIDYELNLSDLSAKVVEVIQPEKFDFFSHTDDVAHSESGDLVLKTNIHCWDKIGLTGRI